MTRPDKRAAWFGPYAGVMLSPTADLQSVVMDGPRVNYVRRWLHGVGRRHDRWRRGHPLP